MFRMLSLAIDLFAALAVLLPAVLLIQYGLFGQRGKKRLAFFTAFAVYLSLVFSVTGLPSAASPVFDPSFNWIPLLDIRNAPLSYLKNTVLNILLFMDPACRSPRRILLAGLGISLFIELLQIFTYRLTDVDDLLTNAFGAFLGYALTVRLSKKKGTCSAVPSGRPVTDAPSVRPLTDASFSRPATGTSSSRSLAAVLFAAVLLNSFFVQPALSGFLWELLLESPLWEAVR